MRTVVYLAIALACWFGSIISWGMAAGAYFDWGALGDGPSNAEIYPIENRLLLGFGLGTLLSLSAMIVTWFAGRGTRPERKSR